MSAESTTETNRNMNAPHADVEVSPEVEWALRHVAEKGNDYSRYARALQNQLGL
ncbi:hypothetical protein M1M38_gp037 [Halorubrum tailed virus 27]|uniref:Uncharacterized protein n=1 Tax=Halorubrum tailed virus 27 TaxID=2878008 RepID=A0AAE8XYJ6_9CAUD|nr:hypothetical protein M1M38_gp037 [Halorubrum tailed virus 27]UBF22730.1 hypothetical protein HRTV-27_gp37 [Halorubrum tailed virus 27]